MLKESNKLQLPFWLITGSVIAILVISQLIQDGMFMDGLLYVTVSKNLASGIGTFWDPSFSTTSMQSFHEQPPLYFGLLAMFYKVFGTSMYVERLFCFTCFTVSALYIYKLWNKIYDADEGMKSLSWLPVLFWVATPCTFWAYTNEVEETVMTVFATASVYYVYCALFLNKNRTLYIVIGGLLIFLSSLTKGVQGMFPIVSAGFFWLLNGRKNTGRMIADTCILLLIPLGIYGLLFSLDHNIYLNFVKYYNGRYVTAFNNTMNTTNTHFKLLLELVEQLLYIITITGVVLFLTRKDESVTSKNREYKRVVLWLFFIGLSGTLPLMVTLEQRGFYIVTAIPFFAIGIAMLAAPGIGKAVSKINKEANGFRVFKIITVLLFVSSIAYSMTRINTYNRDGDVLKDIYVIGKITHPGDTISIPTEMEEEWNVREYFMRYFNVNLLDEKNKHCKLFMIRKTLPKSLVPEDYKSYDMGTKTFDIYKKN